MGYYIFPTHMGPYTNFHDLNLDWILSDLKELGYRLENFVKLATLKYSDPIQWDITRQYGANTVVVDPSTHTGYISIKPVPQGVQIDNTDYWQPIADFSDAWNYLRDAITTEGDTGDRASSERTPGDLVWLGNGLYQITQTIPQGDLYIPGTNCIKITIGDLFKNFVQDTQAVYNPVLSELISKGMIPASVAVLNAAVTGKMSLPEAISAASTMAKPVVILLDPGTYDIMGLFPPASNPNGMVIPNGVYLVGQDKYTTLLSAIAPGDKLANYSTVHFLDDGGCFNLTIYGEKVRYCIHDDNNHAGTLTSPHKRVVYNCILRAKNLYYTHVYGAGFHWGNEVLLEKVQFDAPTIENGCYFHSNYDADTPLYTAHITLKDCICNCSKLALMQSIQAAGHGDTLWEFIRCHGFVYVDQPPEDRYANIIADQPDLYIMGWIDIARVCSPNVGHYAVGAGTAPIDQDVCFFWNNKYSVSRLPDRNWKYTNILGICIGGVRDGVVHLVQGGIWDNITLKTGGAQQTFVEYDTNCNVNTNVGTTKTDYSVTFVNQAGVVQCIF